MKLDGRIMEILASYDLTGSLRATAELTGCSHHTVARHVAACDAGKPIAVRAYRGRFTDPFMPKIKEWVEVTKGKIRSGKAHDKLVALGFEGSDRSVQRAVAQVRAAYRLRHVRVHRPWVTEPGMWLHSMTSATGRWSRVGRRCCSSRGWRGAAIWCAVVARYLFLGTALRRISLEMIE